MASNLNFTPITNLLLKYEEGITLPLIKQLVEEGADIRESDDLALRAATTFADLECVQYFVELGANIFANDNEPIFNGIQNNLGIAQYLISKGCSPYTCPDWQLGGYPTSAASKGDLPLLKYLIEDLKLPHNLDDNAAFRYACRENKINTMEYLFSLGVNIENDNNSSFVFACENNALDSIDFLIKKKVNIKNDLQKVVCAIILKENFHILPLMINTLFTKEELLPFLNEECLSYLKFYDMENQISDKPIIKKKKI